MNHLSHHSMAKRGGTRHLKRHAAPRSWPVVRKGYTWITKPSPGPHPKEMSVPLLILIRDILKLAETAREARKIIKARKVLVDKRIITDHRFPVGLMDVVEFPDLGKYYRISLNRRGKITAFEIEEKESEYKLVKIKNKTTVKGGHIQLNLHDGRNILIRVSDPKNPVEDVYKTKDSLLIRLPSQEIVNHIKYEVGKLAFLIGGKHVGELARIRGIREYKGPWPNRTILESNGESFETLEEYVFVVGEESPVIKVIGDESNEENNA